MNSFLDMLNANRRHECRLKLMDAAKVYETQRSACFQIEDAAIRRAALAQAFHAHEMKRNEINNCNCYLSVQPLEKSASASTNLAHPRNLPS